MYLYYYYYFFGLLFSLFLNLFRFLILFFQRPKLLNFRPLVGKNPPSDNKNIRLSNARNSLLTHVLHPQAYSYVDLHDTYLKQDKKENVLSNNARKWRVIYGHRGSSTVRE